MTNTNTNRPPTASKPYAVYGPLAKSGRGYATRGAAWRAIDRLDAEYGASRHYLVTDGAHVAQ